MTNSHESCNSNCNTATCFTIPINFSAISQSDGQLATVTNHSNSTGDVRWTQTNVPYPRVKIFKDEDIFTLDVIACNNNFAFTQNYNYIVNDIVRTMAISPLSETTPIGYGEQVTMTTNTTNIFVMNYDFIEEPTFSPINFAVPTFGSIDHLSYVFNDQLKIDIVQVDTPTEVQISLNKRIGFMALSFKIVSNGCINIIDVPAVTTPTPIDARKTIYVNGQMFINIDIITI